MSLNGVSFTLPFAAKILANGGNIRMDVMGAQFEGRGLGMDPAELGKRGGGEQHSGQRGEHRALTRGEAMRDNYRRNVERLPLLGSGGRSIFDFFLEDLNDAAADAADGNYGSAATAATIAIITRGAGTKVIDPAAVRFSQSSISRNFSSGGSIDDLAASLRSGATKPGDVPAIRLVERNGQLFTLDNRRLEAFRRAGVPISYRMATPEEAAAEAWKFTTRNNGASIRVRGE